VELFWNYLDERFGILDLSKQLSDNYVNEKVKKEIGHFWHSNNNKNKLMTNLERGWERISCGFMMLKHN